MLQRRRRGLHATGIVLRQSPLAAEVGALFQGDLARLLLEFFDYKILASVATVNRRWGAAASALAPLREKEFRESAGPKALYGDTLTRKVPLMLDFLRDSVSPPPNAPWGQVTVLPDPLANQLARRFENGFGCQVVDTTASTAASFVAYVNFMRTMNVISRILVVAAQSEMAKWTEACQGQACFRGDPVLNYQADLDASDDTTDRTHLYVCSDEQLRRTWSRFRQLSATWRTVVYDIGYGSLPFSPVADYARPRRYRAGPSARGAAVSAEHNYYVFCRTMPPEGLNLEELVSRFELFMECRPFDTVLDGMKEGAWFASDTPEKRLLLELVRRDMAKYIADSPFSIDVQALGA